VGRITGVESRPGAANQEDCVMAKTRHHAVSAFNGHAARRGRKTGLHIAQGFLHGNGRIAAFLIAEGEAPTGIGKNRDIRAKDTKQAPEQHGRRHAMFGVMDMRAGEAWMRHHRKAVFACQMKTRVRPDQHWRNQRASAALRAGKFHLVFDLIEAPGDHREIKRLASGLGIGVADRFLQPGYPFLEGVEGLIHQPVITSSPPSA
jgi:hypothetical protein